MSSASVRFPDTHPADSLTDLLQTKLRNPTTSSEFDFHSAVDQVLADVGLTAKHAGGKLTFYGRDPIVPSGFKFGAMAAVGLAAKTIAHWRRTGHSCRRPESSAALLWFLRRQMGNDQRTRSAAPASR